MPESAQISLPFLAFVKSRLPGRVQILPAFSTVVFIVFTWTLFRMFYQLPSWLAYLSLGKILALAAYVLSFALLESLVITALLLALAALLPERYLRRDFAVQGSILVGLMGIGAYLIQRKIGLLYKLEPEQLALYSLAALAGIVIAPLLFTPLLERLPKAARLLRTLAERMTVFATLYTPLGLVSLLVALLRNLF